MAPRLKFGTGYLRKGSVDHIVDQAIQAEELGYDLFGVADSQALGRELYVSLGPVARETSTIRFGPSITNPVTRHPVVTASAMASLDELSAGRAVMGFGSGDSSVYTIGESPAKLTEMEAAITRIKALWHGDSIDLDGKPVQLRWLNDPRHIPVALAAEGPKTLELAGRVADEVIIGLGITPDAVSTALDHVARGARAADRNPDSIQTWFFVHGNIAHDRDTAIDDIKMALAGSAHHSLQFSLTGKAVPEKYQSAIRELVDRYNPDQHEQADDTINRRLVEDLNLTEYLADRYAIAGTPADCISQLQELRRTAGVDGVLLSSHAEEKRSAVRRFGTEVIPEL